MTFHISFSFFLDQFWQELVMTQCDTISRLIIRGIDDTTCTVKNVHISVTCLTVKVVVVPFIHPALRLRFLHVDLSPHAPPPLKRTFRLFLATNNIYLLASQVTKDRLRVRKKQKEN